MPPLGGLFLELPHRNVIISFKFGWKCRRHLFSEKRREKTAPEMQKLRNRRGPVLSRNCASVVPFTSRNTRRSSYQPHFIREKTGVREIENMSQVTQGTKQPSPSKRKDVLARKSVLFP